jgi:hypothetical protein
LYAKEQYNETIVYCDSLIAYRTQREEAWMLRGKAHVQPGLFVMAISDFTQILRYNIDQTEAYVLRTGARPELSMCYHNSADNYH